MRMIGVLIRFCRRRKPHTRVLLLGGTARLIHLRASLLLRLLLLLMRMRLHLRWRRLLAELRLWLCRGLLSRLLLRMRLHLRRWRLRWSKLWLWLLLRMLLNLGLLRLLLPRLHLLLCLLSWSAGLPIRFERLRSTAKRRAWRSRSFLGHHLAPHHRFRGLRGCDGASAHNTGPHRRHGKV